MARVYKYFYNKNYDTLLQVEIEGEDEIVEITELACGHTVELQEEDASEEESEEEEEEETPKPTGSRSKRSIPVEYDRDALKDAIKMGDKPAKIAERFGVSVAVVYTTKSDMKKAGELDGSPAKVGSNISPNFTRVKELVDEGYDESYIYDKMHDLMTDAQFREALEWAKS